MLALVVFAAAASGSTPCISILDEKMQKVRRTDQIVVHGVSLGMQVEEAGHALVGRGWVKNYKEADILDTRGQAGAFHYALYYAQCASQLVNVGLDYTTDDRGTARVSKITITENLGLGSRITNALHWLSQKRSNVVSGSFAINFHLFPLDPESVRKQAACHVLINCDSDRKESCNWSDRIKGYAVRFAERPSRQSMQSMSSKIYSQSFYLFDFNAMNRSAFVDKKRKAVDANCIVVTDAKDIPYVDRC